VNANLKFERQRGPRETVAPVKALGHVALAARYEVKALEEAREKQKHNVTRQLLSDAATRTYVKPNTT